MDKIVEQHAELKAVGGNLRATGDLETSLAFYRDEYVLATDPDGDIKRSDFLRGPDGTVAWLRDGGRLWRSRGEPRKPSSPDQETDPRFQACRSPASSRGRMSVKTITEISTQAATSP
jgi:hypothetical protein